MTNFVTVEGRTLKRAMQVVSAVIETRNTIPVLSHVLLTCEGPALTITGTDLDIFAEARVDLLDCAGRVAFCVDSAVLRRLAEVAGVMPVRFEQQDGGPVNVTLGSGEALYTLYTLPAAEFPSSHITRDTLLETFPDGRLQMMLEKVRGCISKEETRYYLNGVYWCADGGKRQLVATDGHRLAMCSYAGGNQGLTGVIVPRKAVQLIVDHLGRREVQVWTGNEKGTALVFTSGTLTFSTKLIDGTYPDYKRVIPPAADRVASFPLKRTEIIEALRRADILRDGCGRAVKLHERDGKMAVGRNLPELGSAIIQTSVDWPHHGKGPVDAIGFNASYLMDFLVHGEGDPTLHMVDTHSPFVITDADDSMTRVLMPMRV